MLSSPIVYHDPSKDLLLTYFPSELGLPIQEQEKQIGPLINQVVNRLPPEQRKAYLLRPQTMLTMQGLIEKVLEADGITKEMIQAQQQKLNLLQRLINVKDEDVLKEIARQEDKNMDAEFFSLMNSLIESAMVGGDQQGAKRLSDLQKALLPNTTAGRQLQEQSKEVESAIRSLQEAGKDLTREKLLDMVTSSKSETQLSVLASLARPLMDYEFFQLLSGKIDRARGDGRERLIKMRDNLLEITRTIDHQLAQRLDQARKNVNTILGAPNASQVLQQNLAAVDEFFVQALNEELAVAREKGDLEKLQKLNSMVDVLQKASAPPPEIALIEELLDVEDENARQEWLAAHKDQINQEFLDTMTGLLSQSQAQEDEELLSHLQDAYRSALRFSMQANLKQ
jgi:hypothetical protein